LGFLDSVFGRKKLKEAQGDKLFALATAVITLEHELGLKPAGAAGVVFKPLSAGEFARVEDDLNELVDSAARQSASRVERQKDDYGYQWIVLHDDDFEDLVGTAHLISSELQAHGFGPQLLASIYRFEDRDGKPVYWIYGYKRAAFWPFVPTGSGQERDNARELRLKTELERELPIEPDLNRWLGLFGAPV
jgi:hypothetical protein